MKTGKRILAGVMTGIMAITRLVADQNLDYQLYNESGIYKRVKVTVK